MPLDRVRTVLGGVGGSPYYSNFYFLNTAGSNQADGCINRVKAFWDIVKGTTLTGMTILIESEVPLINEIDGKMTGIHTGTGYSTTATGAGTPMPGFTQGLIRLHTGGFVNGKNVRGHCFVPGNLEENNANGRPLAAYQTILYSAVNALLQGPPTLQVWARPFKHKTDPTKNRDGSTHTVVNATVWDEWSVLRSRRTG